MPDTEDQTGVTRTWATLRIDGRDLDPAVVTSRLDLTPSDAFQRGDRHGKHGTHTRGHGHWALTSEGAVESTDLEDHLLWIVEKIEPAQAQLAELMKGSDVKADLFCFWETERLNSGLEFSPALLGRISALNLLLDLDIYFAF